MLERFSKYFIQGTFFLLPFFIILYAIYFIIFSIDDFFKLWLPDALAFRGSGFLLAASIILFTGFLVSQKFMKQLRKRIELLITRIPVVKTIYESTNDIISYIKGDRFKQKGQKVVVIRPPHKSHATLDENWQVVGLVTQNDLSQIPELLTSTDGPSDKIGVYIPLSYQIGGLTVFFPRSWVHEVNIPFEKALRGTFTGWILNGDGYDKEEELPPKHDLNVHTFPNNKEHYH